MPPWGQFTSVAVLKILSFFCIGLCQKSLQTEGSHSNVLCWVTSTTGFWGFFVIMGELTLFIWYDFKEPAKAGDAETSLHTTPALKLHENITSLESTNISKTSQITKNPD